MLLAQLKQFWMLRSAYQLEPKLDRDPSDNSTLKPFQGHSFVQRIDELQHEKSVIS